MTRSERCEAVVYLGLQSCLDGPPIPLFWDPLTGTTFTVHDQESVAEALDRVSERFAATPTPLPFSHA